MPASNDSHSSASGVAAGLVGVEAAYSWMERHATRILAAGALVTMNLVALELFRHVAHDSRVYSALSIALVFIMFLLLHRLAVRMIRFALRTARHQSATSRQLLEAVERFGSQEAGVRGTIEALCETATEAGCEAWVWEPHERALWTPGDRRVVLTAARARRMLDAMAQRKALTVIDTGVVSYLPADVAGAGYARSLVVAPMWSGAQLVGIVLKRYSSRAEMQRASEGALVSGIAALGAVAIGKAHVVDSEQQRVRDNELLLRSVQLASETASRDHLTAYSVQAAETLGVRMAAIMSVVGGELRLVGSHGVESPVAVLARRIPLDGEFVSLVRTTGSEPLVLGRSDVGEQAAGAIAQLGFAREVVVQPVEDASGFAGVLIVDAPRHLRVEASSSLSEREIALLVALSRQVSLTIERSRMLRAINKHSRHMACTPKLARHLTGQRDPVAVARIAARELHEGFGYGRVSIALRGSDEPLAIVASAGMLARSSAPVTCTPEIHAAFDHGRPYVACGGPLRVEASGSRPMDLNAPAGCRSQLVVPIMGGDGQCIGAIAVYERDPESLGEDDLNILQTIADQMAGTLEQAALFETLERSYFKTVEALSAALEAKDAYTLDHAQSITELSAAVGVRMGMHETEIRDLKLGALLHDIGKIGVPGEILNKPGPLTDDEFDIMKEHTIIGEQIIAPIEFLAGVRPMVLHEHERWDGAGYPHGLQGVEIPLGARIIFVCDAWHAMTSDRPYREALPLEEAGMRLRAASGTQFDPEVVDAFLDVLSSEDGARLAGISAS